MTTFVYGAGAAGRVAVDILRAMGSSDVAFVDDAPNLWGKAVMGVQVHPPKVLDYPAQDDAVLLAIGRPGLRLDLARRLAARGIRFANAIHPSAVLLPSVRVGVGCTIGAGTVVETEATIADHCIFSPNVLIGHDVSIGEAVGIGGGATVGARTSIGAAAFLCLQCVILTNRTVGAGAVVGAGSLVQSDVPPNVLVLGCPARPVWAVDSSFDWKKIL